MAQLAHHSHRSLAPTSWAVGALVMVLLLPGCSTPRIQAEYAALPAVMNRNPATLRGNLEVWSWNIAAKALQKIKPDFERRYPGVRVNVDMTGANMQARLLLSLAAGVGAPDVSQLQIAEAGKYISTGRLTDLTPVAAKYRAMFPESSWKNCLYNGRVYAIPWDIGPCAVFYKRGLFARYGVDPNAIETWDDYIAAGKTILQRSGGKTRMMSLFSESIASMFEILLQEAGGQVFDDQGRIAIDSPQSAQALDVMKRLLKAGICAKARWWGQEFMASLKDDSIASYPLAVWFGGTMKDTVQDFPGEKKDLGVFRLPAIQKGGLRTSNLGGSVLVIPAECRQKDAAWAFIEYALCTGEGQIAQYKAMDLFPAFLPAQDDPYFDKADPFFSGQQVSRLFAKDVTRIPALNRTEDWGEAMRYIDQALTHWAAGDMNDEGFFRTLGRRMSRRLGREIAPGPTHARTQRHRDANQKVWKGPA